MMKKVHVALVGGQPYPVYNCIKAVQPDEVVLVYSEASRTECTRLKKELQMPIQELPLDPTDPVAIEATATSLAERLKAEEVTVNITSGLKSWSHLFGVTFDKYSNAAVLYMDQNNTLWNYRTMTSMGIFPFDMEVQFRLAGNPLSRYTRFESYGEEDEQTVAQLEHIHQRHTKIFTTLCSAVKPEQRAQQQRREGRIEDMAGRGYVEWIGADFVRIVIEKPDVEEYLIESPHAKALTFNARWYEYKVARLLGQHPDAKEVMTNCEFPVVNVPQNAAMSGRAQVKNEIDIIVNMGSKLLFVECKTGITKPTDIDKFRTATKVYGGFGSKALFVVQSPLAPMHKEKCKESDVLHFSFARGTERQLYKLINDNMQKINAK